MATRWFWSAVFLGTFRLELSAAGDEMTEYEKADASFAYITDAMSGAHNVDYFETIRLVREMGRRADKGDKAALELLQVVYRFERLLKLYTKFKGEPR